MQDSDFFDDKVRTATLRNSDSLQSLKLKTAKYFPGFDQRITFLCSSNGHLNNVTARVLRSYPVVLFSEEFIRHAPDLVVQTVACHELIHLQMGCELRDELFNLHPDLALLFHDSIIPLWLKEEVEINSDSDYLLSKGWRMLYNGWYGPTDVEFDKALDTVNRYFISLKQGLVFTDNGRICVMPPSEDGSLKKSREVTGNHLDYNSTEGILNIVTGYELLEYLRDCLRATFSSKYNIDLSTLEEAFANFVSAGFTQLKFEELQKWAPQDRVKIELASKMQASANSELAVKVFERSRTYRDLVSFCRESDIL